MNSEVLGSPLAKVDEKTPRGSYANISGEDIRGYLAQDHQGLLSILSQAEGVTFIPHTAGGASRAAKFKLLNAGTPGRLAYLCGRRGHTGRVVQDGLVIRARVPRLDEAIYCIFHVIPTSIFKREVSLTVLTEKLQDWPRLIIPMDYHDITDNNNLTPAVMATLNVIQERRLVVDAVHASRPIQTNDLTGIGFAATIHEILITNSYWNVLNFAFTESIIHGMSAEETQRFREQVENTFFSVALDNTNVLKPNEMSAALELVVFPSAMDELLSDCDFNAEHLQIEY